MNESEQCRQNGLFDFVLFNNDKFSSSLFSSSPQFDLVSSGVLDPSPSVRWGHSQCLVTSPSGNHVVVIGGQTVKNAFCRDATWLYDPSFGEWEALETGTTGAASPGMRMGHSAVFDPAKNCIYVYGGSKNTRWFKDMHMLSLDKGAWQELKASGKRVEL